MKFSININQEKLIELAPKATLPEAALIDFLYHFCSSISPAIEQCRITGPDGNRYTWVNYDHVLSDLPLLGTKEKKTITRLMKNVETMGFITSISPDHRRKYVALTEKIEKLYRTGDKPGYKPPKLWSKGNSTVVNRPQPQGKSYSRSTTNQNTSYPNTNYQGRKGVDKSTFRTGTGMESIGSVMKRR